LQLPQAGNEAICTLAEVTQPFIRRLGLHGGSGRRRNGHRGHDLLCIARGDARPLGQFRGPARLLGSGKRRGSDGHDRRLGCPCCGESLLDPALELADQRWPRALRQQPVLRGIARRALHRLKVRRPAPNSSARHERAFG